MAWTPEMESRLRLMWSEKATSRQIAKELGVTPNSVIGKVHRLGLEKRPSPIKFKTKTTSVKKAPIVITEEEKLPEPKIAPKNYKGKVCQWIYGAPVDAKGKWSDKWHYCNLPIASRGSTPGQGKHGVYCETHLAKVYKPKDFKTKSKKNWIEPPRRGIQ